MIFIKATKPQLILSYGDGPILKKKKVIFNETTVNDIRCLIAVMEELSKTITSNISFSHRTLPISGICSHNNLKDNLTEIFQSIYDMKLDE